MTSVRQNTWYEGYLCVAVSGFQRVGKCIQWGVWDPSQPVATRPLAIQKGGTWYTYGYDITKNVCELFNTSGNLSKYYGYTPFGAVSSSSGTNQPFQWSSEYYDSELGLVIPKMWGSL